MRMSEKEKEEKREFESKRKEADDLEYKINVTVWKINKPKNIKEADQIIKKCKKILEILESEELWQTETEQQGMTGKGKL